MKISLAKHGGFAAGIRRPPLSVESSSLSEQTAAELTRLVAAVKAAPAEAERGPGRARDAMSYTLTLEENNGEKTVFRASDVTMSPPFAALLQWVENHSAVK